MVDGEVSGSLHVSTSLHPNSQQAKIQQHFYTLEQIPPSCFVDVAGDLDMASSIQNTYHRKLFSLAHAKQGGLKTCEGLLGCYPSWCRCSSGAAAEITGRPVPRGSSSATTAVSTRWSIRATAVAATPSARMMRYAAKASAHSTARPASLIATDPAETWMSTRRTVVSAAAPATKACSAAVAFARFHAAAR